MKNNELLVVGDTHSITIFSDIIRNLNIEDASILHIGDCGIGFSGRDIAKLDQLNRLGVERNINIYIIRGNHDDPSYWERGLKLSNVTLVQDYTSLVFPNTKKAICIGGGVSIDRIARIPNVSWWANEKTEYLPEYCTPHDYMFAHDAPTYFNLPNATIKENFPRFSKEDATLVSEAYEQRQTIDRITALCKPSKIIGGHFHRTVTEIVDNVEYRGLDINEVYYFLA